jgi:hypothetical protein
VYVTAPALYALALEIVTWLADWLAMVQPLVCVPAVKVALLAEKPVGAVQLSVYNGELEQKSIRTFFAPVVAVKLTKYDAPVALAAEVLIWMLRLVSCT